MPPQRILPPGNPMPLIREIQKLALNPPALTHVERRQAVGDGTPVVQVGMDDEHGRVPVGGMARGIPFVVFGLVGPEGAFEVGGEGRVDVGGVEVRQTEDAVVADQGAEFVGERLAGDPEVRVSWWVVLGFVNSMFGWR